MNQFKRAIGLGKNLIEPVEQRSIMGNQTQEHDVVSRQWQALIVGNSYDLNTFNQLDAVIQNNFGTIDNPHVIFTSDAPSRFVGCTGVPNEDDYEGHEIMFMNLRENLLQRCQLCGQVFKLVRLRDEYSAENDYYQSGMLKPEMSDMLQSDFYVNMSPIRFAHLHFYEPTGHQIDTNRIYTLVNNDDHSRILTDPAYRLQRTELVIQKEKVMIEQLDKLKQIENQKSEKFALSKEDYQNLVEAEIIMKRYNKIYYKLSKFYNRALIDPVNHER